MRIGTNCNDRNPRCSNRVGRARFTSVSFFLMTKPGEIRPQSFGAHMSIAGGLHRAIERGQAAGCDCLQIFVRNQRQWSAKPLEENDVRLWKASAQMAGMSYLVAHASYLVNLASADTVIWDKSVVALTDELERCEALGVPHLVFHPGAYVEATLKDGIGRITKGINEIHQRTRGLKASLLLETTAGQGSAIGHRFEHLADILAAVRAPARLGVCVDTCHIFAAGYALSPPDAYAATIQEFEHVVGVEWVKCIHVNDSKRDLGSRVDRHEHIGEGRIGLAGFRNLVNDARFFDVPKILETPKGTHTNGRDLDMVNLARLRRLVRRKRRPVRQ